MKNRKDMSMMTRTEMRKYVQSEYLDFDYDTTVNVLNSFIETMDRTLKFTNNARYSRYNGEPTRERVHNFFKSYKELLPCDQIDQIMYAKLELSNRLKVTVTMCNSFGLALNIHIDGYKKKLIQYSDTCDKALAKYIDELVNTMMLEEVWYCNNKNMLDRYIERITHGKPQSRICNLEVQLARQCVEDIMVTIFGADIIAYGNDLLDETRFKLRKEFEVEKLALYSCIRFSNKMEAYLEIKDKKVKQYGKEIIIPTLIMSIKDYNSGKLVSMDLSGKQIIDKVLKKVNIQYIGTTLIGERH